MSALPRAACLLLLTALGIAAGVGAPAVASTPRFYCGTFTLVDGARVAANVSTGPTACPVARRIIRRYDAAVGSRTCRASACPRQIGAYRCSSAPPAALPRLYTCATRGLRFTAYSTAG